MEDVKGVAKNNFGAFLYELIGTSIIMYAMMVLNGEYLSATLIV